MRIQMRAVHVAVRPAVRAAIEEKLEAVLGRFEQRIVRAEVWVVDVNGPRGGPDKRCRMRVKLRPRGRLYIQETDSDVTVAADRALERLVIALNRSLERRRDMRRGRGSRRVVAEQTV